MASTIKDVARLANVSPSTVSRVISNNPRISEATREVVFKAMKELNYKPNASARNLANSSTKTLGVIVPNTDENLFKNPFFIQALRGISIYAQKRNYKIMFNYSPSPSEDLKFVKEFVSSRWVDGMVLLTTYENDYCIDYLRAEQFPFVVIGRPSQDQDILWVDNDNFQATYHVVNELIKSGYREIGFIGGPLDYVFSKDRLEGYKRALELRNITFDPDLIIEGNDFTDRDGYLAMEKLCANKIPQAIVTTDDLIAFGVIRYMKKHQIIAKVTGFNNTTLAEYQDPPLTSVDIKAEALGYHAAQLLIKSIEKEEIAVKHCIVDTELINR